MRNNKDRNFSFISIKVFFIRSFNRFYGKINKKNKKRGDQDESI